MSGAVAEKMGQSIRSRNLKKSGFSVVDGMWSKTSVAEGEAIIGDIPEDQEAVAEPADQAGGPDEEVMAAGHTEVQSELVADVEVQAGTQQDVVMEDAPARGEQLSVEVPAPIQGEQAGIEKPENEAIPEKAAPTQEIPAPAKVDVSEGPSTTVNLEEPVTQQDYAGCIVKVQWDVSGQTSYSSATRATSSRASRAICSRVRASRAICSRVRAIRAISREVTRTSGSLRVFRTLPSSQRESGQRERASVEGRPVETGCKDP
ncbi:hypothetical protein Taro_010007 [Colocasia esculenta]|uniref:Uncharacterized protein n=1 Tax=Colocasia esculenta TaxID=4460 RepID=A0A843U6H5_COLES|nr:hypothetical protein [Colocasia esculenta]